MPWKMFDPATAFKTYVSIYIFIVLNKIYYSFFLLMEIFISSCLDFQQRLVRPPYKFAILGTTCENTKGYSGISSKSECQAAVKTQPKGSNLFIDDMSGKGHDLPKGCIADALSLNKKSVWDPIIMIGNPKKAVYWNPEGVATSNDAKIREICAYNGQKGKINNDCVYNTKYYIILYTSII